MRTNYRIFVALLALFMLLVASVIAQDEGGNEWLLVPTGFDSDAIEARLEGFIRQGYVPVGMDATADGLLFLVQKELGGDSFYLHYFSDLAKLNEEFSQFIARGWAPADIAFTENGMFALFLSSPRQLESWRMISLDGVTNLEIQRSMRSTLETMAKEGRIPFGLSKYRDKLMVGFSEPYRAWESGFEGLYFIDSYKNDGVSFPAGVNRRVNDGFHIVGYEFDGDQIYVGFVR
jgi:hypothetical protein